ncbi:transglutaminase-like cysteine peptidase [Alishewanella sp. HL-SH06]|uniref:transglutaminase-like cysteine peptidase n=1 Tax=Alishewanella sp. HL-SH06 TaxID=3461144 RepID=UPI0040410398
MLFIAAALHNHALETPFLIDFSQFDRYLEQSSPASTTLATSSAWQQMLQDAANLPVVQQLETVNTFLHNTLSYELDASLYQVEDYWASPAEILASRRGDCEDWAITSYISLRALGIPDTQLRLVYVRARVGAEHSGLSLAHMVLAYYPDTEAEPLIIDSLIQNILPASARPDLTPVFSFNSTGLWAGSGNQKSKHSASARLSRWRDLVARLSLQGIFL